MQQYFQYLGEPCTNIDECALNTHNCTIDRSTCQDTEGSYYCPCKLGWVSDVLQGGFQSFIFEMGQSESLILFENPNEQHQVSGSQQGTYTNVTYDQEKTHSFGGADNCVDYDECTGGVSHLSLDGGAIMT